MKNTVYVWPAAGQIASTAVIQVLPMLILPVHGYAVYAVIYLVFAAFLALQNATICDVWARMLRRSESTSSQLRAFQAALTALATLSGTAAGLIALVVSDHGLLAAAAGAATAFAMYRSGISYRLVATERIRRAGLSALLGAIVAGLFSVSLLALGAYTTTMALLCWALGALCASLSAGIGPVASPRAVVDWFVDNRHDVGLLSAETAIKTIETVGTPLLVGAIGGALPLALHRAASSLTYPVRVVVEVLRARLVSGAIGGSLRGVLVMGTIGVLAGTSVTVGLTVLENWGLLGAGTIVVALAPHALAVGAWLCTMAVSSFVQFMGRGRFNGRALIARRIANTVVVLGVTGSGVLLFGVAAVVWSAALAELLAALLWISRRADDGSVATPRDTDARLRGPATLSDPTAAGADTRISLTSPER